MSSLHTDFILAFVTGSNVTCSFSSSYTLFETQYKCTIGADEFNYSSNPSIISGSEGQMYDFATGSYFAPYVTTVKIPLRVIGSFGSNINGLAITFNCCLR